MKFRKGKEIAWGILLLAGAALLIASQVGIDLSIGEFSWFQIIVLIGCAWFAITGLFELQFFNLSYGVALAYVIADEPMGWPEMNGWIVFLAATIAAIGLHKIFKRRWHKSVNVKLGKNSHLHFGFSDDDDDEDAEEVEYREVIDEVIDEETDEDSPEKDHKQEQREDNQYQGREVVFAQKTIYTGKAEIISGEYVFSGVNAYVEGKNVRQMNYEMVFSKARIYFDNAQLCDNYAEIQTDVVFSRLFLYVPKNWNVIDETGKVGGRAVTRDDYYREGAPTLRIKGDCVFGRIRVKRI